MSINALHLEGTEKILTAIKVQPYSTNSLKAQNVLKNSEILKWLIKVNILCVNQCIAFRGHRENINSNQNPGDFLSVIKLLAETNKPVLGNIENPSR